MNIFNAQWGPFWQTLTKMSWFEVGMLLCFGASWPFSILKMVRTKRTEGKSRTFLALVLLGYVFGILHKLFFNLDVVILLYAFLFFIVLADLSLCVWLRRRQGKE